MPDFVWRIEDLFTQDGRIAARLRDAGTPAKRWLGFEPTGASVEFTEFASYRVRDGRFLEMWFLMDIPSVSEQLSRRRPIDGRMAARPLKSGAGGNVVTP